MTLIKQEFQKHIKKINNNDFIYKHKIAFYLLSEQQFKLYEEGFKKGFELSRQLSLNTKPFNISLVNSLSQSIE